MLPKPFTVLRSLGQESERLTNDYITYTSTVRRIRQQLLYNHCCKDYNLVPAGLKLKSPLNTQEVIQIIRATCRRLVKARLNNCHRRLKRYKNKTQLLQDKLKQLIPTELLDTVSTIADKRDNKATERARTGHQKKLTGRLRNKEQRRSKPDDNWVRNISSRSLKRKLLESTKDNIRSRIASTIQSALQHGSNLTKDEQHALKRLKNDEDIVILPADRGRITVVMDKTDYHD